jgi:putative intracellular protease/amidase
MHVAIPLYPGYTALDAVGPYTVLAFAPGWTVTFAAAEPGPVPDRSREPVDRRHGVVRRAAAPGGDRRPRRFRHLPSGVRYRPARLEQPGS